MKPQCTVNTLLTKCFFARRRGEGVGSTGSNESPLQVNINDGGLKTQAANFHLLANSGELENKL